MLLAGFLSMAQGDWGSTHEIEAAWRLLVDRIGEVAFLVVVLTLVVHALVRRSRYKAVDVLSEQAIANVHAAIVAAEKRTVGEIVPVVVERSDPHPGAHWLAALTALFGGTIAFFEDIDWHEAWVVIGWQIGFALLGYGLSRVLPGVQRLFTSARHARATAEEQAFQEFYGAGLHRTEAQTGVLLFVSLFEHRVVVLADEGIASQVEADQWVETDRAILAGIRSGSLEDGLVAGIQAAAELLAEHFPWTEGDRNEVPDRVIVRRE